MSERPMKNENHINLSHLPADTYVAHAQIDHCKVCGKREDLRMGACYTCADLVDGRQLSDGSHQLWERARPENRWIVREM